MKHIQPSIHPATNIIQMFTSVSDETNTALILEYMTCDSIESLLLENVRLTEEQVAVIVHQIVNALEVVHNSNVVHRDVKPSNFLMNMMGEVKLSDFGIASTVQSINEPELDEFVGTLHYLAPEVARRERYGAACDVWSLGISMIQMLFGTVPLGDHPGIDALSIIKDPNYNPLDSLVGCAADQDAQLPPNTKDSLQISAPNVANVANVANTANIANIANQYAQLSPNTKDFLQICLTNDWNNRATIKELKKHPFVAKKTRKSTLFAVCDIGVELARRNHGLGK